MEPILDSGTQYVLTRGAQVATVVERGGGVRTYEAAGVPVLDGYREDEPCPGAAGAVLAPWPNRIRHGCYEFDGRRHQLAIDEPTTGHALHGLVRDARWTATRNGPDAIDLATTIAPREGYPFHLAVTVRWTLGDDGLSALHTATNVGDTPCPFGLAVHSYVWAPGVPVDATLLRVPASRVVETDATGIPTATRGVKALRLDFRRIRDIGARQIDSAFTSLERGADGLARVEVRGPEGGGAVVWMDERFAWVQVFTGDTLSPERRRRSVAVEPMTCPADAFRTGEGLVVLAPGETWSGRWGVSPE